MALFDPGFTPCALCGVVLTDDDDHVGTSHFIGDHNHPLYRYSDTLMHRECFLRWDHRAEFVDAYNAVMRRHHWMGPDGTIKDPLWFRLFISVVDKISEVESFFGTTSPPWNRSEGQKLVRRPAALSLPEQAALFARFCRPG